MITGDKKDGSVVECTSYSYKSPKDCLSVSTTPE